MRPMPASTTIGMPTTTIIVDESEFTTGLYDTWDQDNDDLISADEFNENADRWLTAGYGFDTWDANGDGFLDEDEYGAGIAGTGLYGD